MIRQPSMKFDDKVAGTVWIDQVKLKLLAFVSVRHVTALAVLIQMVISYKSVHQETKRQSA